MSNINVATVPVWFTKAISQSLKYYHIRSWFHTYPFSYFHILWQLYFNEKRQRLGIINLRFLDSLTKMNLLCWIWFLHCDLSLKETNDLFSIDKAKSQNFVELSISSIWNANDRVILISVVLLASRLCGKIHVYGLDELSPTKICRLLLFLT